MTQLKNVVEPFGEINVYPAAGGKVRVTATILMEPHKEGAQTGIALDGSGSMKKVYGVDDGGGVVSSLFARRAGQNDVSPVAQQLCAYLARRIASNNSTTCIYWATGDNGTQVEVVGDFRAEEAEHHVFGPPRDFGTGTHLLPAVRYFVDRFKNAPWGFYVFITDGELHDLEEVKRYSTQLAREITAGRRNPLKFVLIGLGSEVNERQMEELDDLDTGTPLDLWDHKLAAHMRALQEIFAEVVDKNARVADHGKILDPQGRVLRNYTDVGLPASFEFEVPVGTAYFTLDVNGHHIHQALTEHAQVPAQQAAATPPTPPAAPLNIPVARPIPQAQPIPTVQPVAKVEVAKEQQDWKNSLDNAAAIVGEDELWKTLDLRPAEKEKTDVDLRRPEDK